MTRTAKTALTATAAALLGAGVTLSTTASGWGLPGWLQAKSPSTASTSGEAPAGMTATAAAAAVTAAPAATS
ncbi:CAP domain-containing protein, partial [Pelomonas puraquae]